MSENTSQMQKKGLFPKDLQTSILSLIGIAFIFGFGYLPPWEPMTPFGMQVFGIFLGMIFLWTFVSLIWPSLLGILAIGLLDLEPKFMVKTLASSFGDPVIVLVFFCMILFGAFQHYGISKYISQWFLTRKMINGRPVLFSFVIFYTTYVLAGLAANLVPAILLMSTILYGILKDVGYKKGDAYTSIMVSGIFFAAMVGQAAKPFTGAALFILSVYEKIALQPINYLSYMLLGLIMSAIVLALYCLIIKYVFRPDMSKIASINIEYFKQNPLPPMDTRQKILFCCLFGFLALVLLPNILPPDLPLVPTLRKLGPWGVSIAIVMCLTLFRIKGEPIIEIKDMIKRYVVWDVYFLLVTCVPVAATLMHPSTGFNDFLVHIFTPILDGQSANASIALILAIGLLTTQVANNAVMGAVLMPLVSVFSSQMGISFGGTAALLTLLMQIAVLTPAASPYAALLFANTEWIDKKDILKYAVCFMTLAGVTYILVGIPLMNVIFAS